MLTIYKSPRGYFLAKEGLTNPDDTDKKVRMTEFFETKEEAEKFIEKMKQWNMFK